MQPTPSRAGIVAALMCVYVVWGSTYLAILWTLETMPPFLMAGVRFFTAGAILLAFRTWRGDGQPSAREWLSGVVTGSLMLLGGNGGVVWAEQHVASGVAALVIGCVPIFIVLFEWMSPKGRRPTAMTVLGLVLGIVGVGLLVLPGGEHSAIDPIGFTVLLLAACSWAAGSLLSREMTLPKSPLLSTAVQMMGGGASLVVVALLAGEPSRLDVGAISAKSWLAFLYLLLFGSILAFSCYAWLLRVTKPAVAATYAYVNPLVAVGLGALLANEPVTTPMIAAAALIIAGVVAITTSKSRVSASYKPAGQE